ncbi:MAG TPA: hypothetical protein VMY18_05705 [Acidobacteriota bacterium]|nr:hypothetical protein [Acidobacteriota bacterium]
MINAWKVLWKDQDGAKKFRRFEGDKPTEAVEFGKELKRRGFPVDVISARKGFPPPLKVSQPDRIGTLWCPYCVKWRDFHETAVKWEGFITPVILRCTTCTISVKDAYVRRYNPLIVAKYEITRERVQVPAKRGRR